MSPRPKKNLDVFPAALELAEVLKAEPAMIEKEIVARGNELISLYHDDNFGLSFRDVKPLKLETLRTLIEDLGMGGMTLISSAVGLTFQNNRVQTFISPHGSSPQGTVIFSVKWKNIVAFKNYRNEDGETEIPQDDLNAAIYRLIVELTGLIDG